MDRVRRHLLRSWLLLVPAFIAGRVAASEPAVEGGVLEFELPDLDGETVRHDDPHFRGRVVLVTLWGTWCPPCITEIPTFNDLHERFGEEGLVVVAIAFERKGSAEERRQRLKDFSRKHAIEYLVLDGGLTRGAGVALPALRNVKGLPVEILIGRDGRVRESRNGYGYSKEWARELEEEVLRLLGESTVD